MGHTLVVVHKTNGRLRVCGDYKVTINQSVEKKIYPLPTAEDFLPNFQVGKFFETQYLPAIPSTTFG